MFSLKVCWKKKNATTVASDSFTIMALYKSTYLLTYLVNGGRKSICETVAMIFHDRVVFLWTNFIDSTQTNPLCRYEVILICFRASLIDRFVISLQMRMRYVLHWASATKIDSSVASAAWRSDGALTSASQVAACTQLSQRYRAMLRVIAYISVSGLLKISRKNTLE